jgi:hypothetical protein
MKKLTTKLMIATATLVVVAGAASAQTMTATIPFEFRVDGRVMEPGTYRVDLSRQDGSRIFDLWNVKSGRRAFVIGQAQVDPEDAWRATGQGKLVFACASGNCTLAELYSGSGTRAHTVHRPKLGKDETAVLREIPLQPAKGE